jgi:hypothetical protein
MHWLGGVDGSAFQATFCGMPTFTDRSDGICLPSALIVVWFQKTEGSGMPNSGLPGRVQ